MNKLRIFLGLAICIWLNTSVYGQSAEDMVILKERAREKVGMLNEYISYMADKNDNLKNRTYYKEAAEYLFINNCDSIKEIIEYRNNPEKKEISRAGVTMDVSSTRNNSVVRKLIKKYFEGLMGLKYKQVRIETTDIADMRVSRLQPYGVGVNGEKLYICSVYFDQLFVGYRGDGGVYKDVTHKWVVCYVEIDDVLDSDTGEMKSEYMIRLGDVHVESTDAII
jgi:hypothetical protein